MRSVAIARMVRCSGRALAAIAAWRQIHPALVRALVLSRHHAGTLAVGTRRATLPSASLTERLGTFAASWGTLLYAMSPLLAAVAHATLAMLTAGGWALRGAHLTVPHLTVPGLSVAPVAERSALGPATAAISEAPILWRLKIWLTPGALQGALPTAELRSARTWRRPKGRRHAAEAFFVVLYELLDRHRAIAVGVNLSIDAFH